MKKIYLFLIMSLLVTMASWSWVQSQEETPQALQEKGSRPPAWADTLDVIKNDIKRIMEENKNLKEEYNALKENIVDIQTSINSYKLENSEIEKDIERTKKLIEQEQYTRDASQPKMERLKQEALSNQSKIDALKEQLAGFDEKLRLWQLQINDLELEKKQLDLELQAQEKLHKGIESGEAEEVKKLREQIAATQNQTDEISRSAEEFSTQNQQSFEEMARLREENKKFEKQISQLQNEKKLKIKETEQRRKNLQGGVPKEYTERLKGKKVLESEISKLESQLESVKKSAEQSAAAQNKKRGLLDRIMNLDRENRELRKKIADLKARMATIKQDPSKFSQ